MPDQRILFSKSGTAKYISHLDLMHTMERAFLRAGITIRHTAGFHPHPYVSIPLPFRWLSSQCELMEFGLEDGCTMEELPQKMNQVLPAGIVIHDCYEGGLPFRALSFVRYDISLEFDGNLAQAAGEAFQELVSRDHFIVQKRSKKSERGFTEVDLIPLIEGVETVQAQGNTLSLTLLLQAQNPGLSPSVLLQGFQTAYPSFVPVYSSCHRREILDQEKNVYR